MQVGQEGQGDQQTDENSPSNKVSRASCDQTFMLMLIYDDMICILCNLLKDAHAFSMKEGPFGEKQDLAAGGSKAKVKVKTVDLPVVANSIRQLGACVLNDFVEYEVSHVFHASNHEEHDVQGKEPC